MSKIFVVLRTNREMFFSVVFSVIATALLVVGVTDAATTISTNINTGGTITVTGAAHFQDDAYIYGRELRVGTGSATTTLSALSATAIGFDTDIDLYGRELRIGTGSATSTLTALSTSLGLNTDFDIYGGDLALGTGSATTTLTSAGGFLGIASTTPWALFSVNPDQVSGPEFAVGSSTKTDFLVTNAGLVGIGSTTPFVALGVTGTTTSSRGAIVGIDGSPVNQIRFGVCTYNPGAVITTAGLSTNCTSAKGVTQTDKVFVTPQQLELGLIFTGASSTAADIIQVTVVNATTTGGITPASREWYWMAIK